MDKKAMLSDNLKYKARLIILAQENKLNTLSGAECHSSAQKPDADRNVGGVLLPSFSRNPESSCQGRAGSSNLSETITSGGAQLQSVH